MDTKTIEAVMKTVTIDTKIDGGKIDAVIGERARMDVERAVSYIKSGEEEIKKAVREGKIEFNENAQDKTDDFNQNAIEKTQEFNQNAVNKTGDFNDNFTDKKNIIDGLVGDASNYADLAKQWAIGDPTEPTGNSAKYWADQSASAAATVNDGQLDIQVNGASVATFTANQSANTTASITVPTDTGDLTNNAGFITGITSGDVTTALGYTPVNPISLASVATSGLYSDLSGTPTVDQTYDGTSANAQSGVAVASAIAGLGITVDQTYDGTSVNAQSGVAIEGELANYVQSSSLASVATSGDYADLINTPTVDQVYDGTSTNAQSGTAVAGAISTKADDDAVVKLTGDQSVAGVKTFNSTVITKGNWVGTGTTAAKGTSPASDEWRSLVVYDNSGTLTDAHALGAFQICRATDGSVQAIMRAYKNTAGSTTNNTIVVRSYSDGTVSTSAPASASINSIVTTTGISKGQNGYAKLGNGIIIQWGKHDVSSSGASTLTFPTAFSNTNYAIGVCRLAVSSTTNESGSFYLRGQTTTTASVYITTNTRSILWVAIGY